jgi:hypothetical protein
MVTLIRSAYVGDFINMLRNSTCVSYGGDYDLIF